MATKKQIVRYTTPKGILRYPALITPDYGSEDFPKPDGEFKTQLVLPKAEADAFLAKLSDEVDAAQEFVNAKFAELPVANRKKFKEATFNPLYSELYDKETEEPTGDVALKFSTKASGVNKKTGKKWERTIPLFDAKGNPITNLDEIWGGTVAKVAFTASPYFVAGSGQGGLKFYLEAVQIIDLRSGRTTNAAGFGFSEEEGYEAEEEEEASGANPFAQDAEEDGNGGDF